MSTLTEIFGPPIYTYTRKQALEDGEQVDVIETAREAGITFPVFLTRAVWNSYVEVPPGVEAQDERGRLWDVLFMMRVAIGRGSGGDRLTFAMYVRNDNKAAKLRMLKAECGPMDVDDPSPAITVMLPDED